MSKKYMSDDFLNPEKEIQKLANAIKQYNLILKTAVDPRQEARVRKKLKELTEYRKNLLAAFEVGKKSDVNTGSDEKSGESGFLEQIAARNPEKPDYDSEVHDLKLYMDFFYIEYLAIFSERKMKLDFKYSLDRDNFHQKFLEIRRRLDDFIDECITLKNGSVKKDVELEMKRRNVKLKRNLFIDANRFFKSVMEFASNLKEDIEKDGSKCLNGDDIISFEFIEEKRHFEGYSVYDAFEEMMAFAKEILDFLNIPDLE